MTVFANTRQWAMFALIVAAVAAVLVWSLAPARADHHGPTGAHQRDGSTNQCDLPIAQRTGGWACP